jgi:hypothetical protein
MKIRSAILPLISTRLQPGVTVTAAASRFNGLSAGEKPLKRFSRLSFVNIGLKPGANEKETGRMFFQLPRPGFVFA